MAPPSPLTADRIADLVGGELVGADNPIVCGVASIESAGADELSFLASRRHVAAAARTQAAVLLVPPELRDVRTPAVRMIVDDPYRAVVQLVDLFHPSPEPAWGVAASASLGRGVRWEGRIAVGNGVVIGAGTALGRDCILEAGARIGAGVSVGDRCRIGCGASVERGVVLGQDVSIHAGARVGTPGFGYVPESVEPHPIPHVGGCVIGNGVRIGANATIDRGTLADTTVGDGTQIDNLVQVGHNTRIGRRCYVMAQVGLAGSTVVEDEVVLAGQAGLAGHLTVGRGARVAAQGGVIGDVPAGATVSDYPARDHRQVLRQAAALRRLAPLVSRLEALVRDDEERKPPPDHP